MRAVFIWKNDKGDQFLSAPDYSQLILFAWKATMSGSEHSLDQNCVVFIVFERTRFKHINFGSTMLTSKELTVATDGKTLIFCHIRDV
jgi:hypothetical protein